MRPRVAVTDDWLGIARTVADWRPLDAVADVTVFEQPFRDEADAAAALAPFDVILPMRERTVFTAVLLAELPRLRLLALTGYGTGHVAMEQALAAGITVCGSGAYTPAATAELTIALILAAQREIVAGDASLRAGRFQEGIVVGRRLDGAVLGLMGVGRIGAAVGRVVQAMGMTVLGWSPNLTAERAAAAGVTAVTKEQLFARSDVVSLHLMLGPSTQGICDAAAIGAMKPGALLVNTARAQLIDEAAMIAAATDGRIRLALDVFSVEPPPADHPIRTLAGSVLTPHLGFSVEQTFATFYSESIDNIVSYLAGAPRRVIAPKPAAALA